MQSDAPNEALKRRGSLTIWFDPGMSWDAAPTGRRGRQQTYSDTAIQTCLTMKVLFGMALRQTTGFVESLLRLVGLDWTAPDISTLSRRQKTLAVNIPYRGSKGPLHLLIDSTAIKRRVARPQAWWPQMAGLAQDPPRDRRGNAGDPSRRDHREPHW
ncbi:MAG: family transposase [Cereibacter sp.]|nr:family transposase [Cereibacter sp.]